MEKLYLNMSFDPADQEAAFVYSILTSMGKGNKRIHCIATIFKMLSAQYGGKITPANLDLISSLIERNGLVPSGYIAVPLGSISSAAPVQAIPDYTQAVAVKTKKSKGKKTNKETVTTKSISAEPVLVAPAEKISPAPVQEIQSATSVSEAAQSDEVQVDDKFITLEEYDKKCIELAQKYILEHFATGQQALGLQMSWHEYETDEDWDELYQMLVEDCTFLANPNNKLPEGYTSMKQYVEDQLADQGYRVKFDN